VLTEGFLALPDRYTQLEKKSINAVLEQTSRLENRVANADVPNLPSILALSFSAQAHSAILMV